MQPSTNQLPSAYLNRIVQLVGEQIETVKPVEQGQNSRVFQLRTESACELAAKFYPSLEHDLRQRREIEKAALAFLQQSGIANIPELVATDREFNFSVFNWIHGEPVTTPNNADVDECVAFLAKLIVPQPGAASELLQEASEGCLSLARLFKQIDDRYRRLADVAAGVVELRAFLEDQFSPARDEIENYVRNSYEALGWGRHTEIPQLQRVLSPSDFGFHNTLKARDERLYFLDFEYFGWDDPVKLAADFMLHPGMELEETHAQRFVDGLSELLGNPAWFRERLRLLQPLFALRWSLIVLNDFLPHRELQYLNVTAGLTGQLGKARNFVRRAIVLLQECPVYA